MTDYNAENAVGTADAVNTATAATATNANDNWLNSISEDYRHSVEKFKSADELARGYINIQRLASSPDKVTLPSENAAPEVWADFYNKLGRPETPDGYEFKAPDGVQFDTGLIDSFRKFAHDNGMNKKAAGAAVQWYMEQQQSWQTQQVEAQKTAAERRIQEATDALKKEWGNDFGDNVALAERALATYGEESDVAALKELGLNNDPRFIRILAKIGRGMLEDSDTTAKSAGLPASIDAKKQISTIRADKSHPYWNPQHIDHKAAVREMQSLYAQIHN